jgi:hypothetical protein
MPKAGKRGRPDALFESFEKIVFYLREELPLDIKYYLLNVAIPLIVGYFVLHGILGLSRDLWKLIVPPDAKEIHR